MRARKGFWLCVVMAAAALGGCGDESGDLVDGHFTPEEWEEIQALSPLPPLEADTTNAFADNPKAAALGQRLFYEKGYAGPIKVANDLGNVGETGKVSCESCHIKTDWFVDTRSKPANTSIAIDWFIRNAPTLVNVATYTDWFGWVGYNDNLWGKCLVPAEFVMGTDRSGIVHFLYQQPEYRAAYDELFEPDLDPALDPMHPDAARFPMIASPTVAPDVWMSMPEEDRGVINRGYANFGKALAAYLRLLQSGNAPFDRYVAGDVSAISESAKRGLGLFMGKAACVACHAGPTFSDNDFHVTGVPQIGEHVLPPDMGGDPGRFQALDVYFGWDFSTKGIYNDDPSIDRSKGVTKDAKLTGAFRTKGLRSVAKTGPFMHTGHLATLREVVEFYNVGGADKDFAGTKDPLMVPLNLTPQEIDDIVAFLETLTGDPIPEALLVDTSFGSMK
ncbi:cytochrome c peroxidase [Polyangium sp. 15x6]|uniref:cytochrome-c peroxidase n=1 Tax=Polyangium sp. 15x6 TaxID=3042687 RepID=UPI00249C19C4|nr:cytochrome c peroxidase [Polyangium sp. 15x6]MDI3288581.1 cytochrome c peroxidase [Polyangium sp. 15x6]